MVARRLTLVVLVAAVILWSARPVMANGISPVAGFLPGFVLISPLLGIPATLLAAFLERPFVTLAGVRRHALPYSIRANLLSWFVGAVVVFCAFVAEPLLIVLMIVWPFAAIPVSIWIEGSYLRRAAARRGDSAHWGWIVTGNIVSGVALMVIGAVAISIGENDPLLGWRLRPYEVSLMVVGGAMSLAIIVYGLWPRPVEKPLAEPASPGPTQQVEKVEQEAEVPAVV